ncbi:GAF domain-containing sensor histidine kinase [Stenomitos frigidus]|uniref:histidine kinase n=1 Tax=Stenomitos frigidus ULC18 TaxID=2107698 RepID=A0A2T1DUZ5_9CYAN|nr:GAF domain-containing sensor histidine kinase [Stenomitos frigidus]PSB24318.1 ATPase [Stenomitos frigidus ULC18]
MDAQDLHPYEHDRRVLEFLATLSYRSGDLGQYLYEIACGVSRLIQSDWSIVTVCQGETGQVVASSLGLGAGDNGFSVHGTLISEITETGRSLIIEDIRQEMRLYKPPDAYLGYMGVPLRTVHGEVSGTICSFFRQARQFTEAEIRTVELFAERAATAIDNYRLYQQQQKFNELLELEVANRTEELRVAQARLVERERLAAIGEFAAMIVHEVRNPLTTMIMGLKYAQKQLLEASARDRLALSLDEADRLQQLLNEILLYAKPQVLQLTKVNLGEFLRALLGQMRELPEATDRSIELKNASLEVEILGDVNKLKQVFINLFRNACEAIASGDTVTCELTHESHPAQVYIHIHNGGAPIPPELLPRLAEPFCSTKPSGTGLGLAIVKRIIEAHDGTFNIESSAAGTVVTVQLPLARESHRNGDQS